MYNGYRDPDHVGSRIMGRQQYDKPSSSRCESCEPCAFLMYPRNPVPLGGLSVGRMNSVIMEVTPNSTVRYPTCALTTTITGVLSIDALYHRAIPCSRGSGIVIDNGKYWGAA